MKRKVIQIANSTQLVSLPRKWALAQNIKKGEELDVKIDADKLIISRDGVIPEISKISIDISGMGKRAKRLIGGLYQAGYDEIEIKYNNLKELELTQDILKTSCIGFEIVDQGRSYVRIKNVSQAAPEEFDMMFKRCMYFLINFSKDGLQAIKDKQVDDLNKVLTIEHTINKLVNFCARILSKRNSKDDAPLYKIVTTIEEAADGYDYLYKHIAADLSLASKRIVKVTEEVNKLVEHTYALLFNFDLAKLKMMYKQYDKIIQVIENYRKKGKAEELEMLHTLRLISRLLFETDASIIRWKCENIGHQH